MSWILPSTGKLGHVAGLIGLSQISPCLLTVGDPSQCLEQSLTIDFEIAICDPWPIMKLDETAYLKNFAHAIHKFVK